MRNKDLEIKNEIEAMLQGDAAGAALKAYFEAVPESQRRRAIHLLASVYPGKRTLSDDDFVFVHYMLSNDALFECQSFADFIRSLSLVDFTERQKGLVIDRIKAHFEKWCETCTFELDGLLIKVFKRADLFDFLETVLRNNNPAVLHRIADLLRYEDFSNADISADALENLKKRVLR
ncbi:MAG: hypothetical protein FWF41_08775 [Betaproteobacteria bacterium]|nr:hypothetical protein [Betaproteobacteria bacterium]